MFDTNNFYWIVYTIMLQLGIKKLELDRPMIIENEAPPLIVTIDLDKNKYIFKCGDGDQESERRLPYEKSI